LRRRSHLDGTRIRVSDGVAQVDSQDKTPEEIVSSCPALSVQDVYAALTYYHERPTQIRQEIHQAVAEALPVGAASSIDLFRRSPTLMMPSIVPSSRTGR